MNSSHERFNNSSAGVKLLYERPTAVFTSPKQQRGFRAQGNHVEDLDSTCGNFPAANSPCDACSH
jgi:hypothetical protein